MGFCCGGNSRVNPDKVAYDQPFKKYTSVEEEEIGEGILEYYKRLPFGYTHVNYFAK